MDPEFRCHLLNLHPTSLNLSQTQRRNLAPPELVSFPLSTPSSTLHMILSVLPLALPALALLLLDLSPRPHLFKLPSTLLASVLSDSVLAFPVEIGLRGTILTVLPSIPNSITSTVTRASSPLGLLGLHQQLDSVTGKPRPTLFIDLPLPLSLSFSIAYPVYLLLFSPFPPPTSVLYPVLLTLSLVYFRLLYLVVFVFSSHCYSHISLCHYPPHVN